jgi:bilirubin oxidase
MGSAGTYWYHPHAHHLTSTQIPKGLAGGLVVRAADDPLTAFPEKLMLLTDNKFTEDGAVAPHTAADHMVGREGNVFFVSGKISPTVPITNGGIQRWRIVNASNARYYLLKLTEGTFLHVGSDGGLFEHPVRQSEVLLAPAERVEVLMESPKSGAAALQTLPYFRGGANPAAGPIELLKVTAAPGPPVAPPTVPEFLRAVPPLDSANPDVYRSILFTGGGSNVTIDGKAFAMDRVDNSAALNTTEYWVVSNSTDMDHPFHLHGFMFQVVDRSGVPEPFPAWKDTVNVPLGGSVGFVVRFTDFPGWRVYHCHILEHEDMGMMAVLDVEAEAGMPSDPPGGVPPPNDPHSH